MAASTSEARRLIAQGAVRLNGEKLTALTLPHWEQGDILQAGRLKCVRLKTGE
jgi:tyrosyl-tRNA synthetase